MSVAPWLSRGAFALCWLFVSFMALTPAPPRTVDLGWDKLNHASAFCVLMLLLDSGWPARRKMGAALLLVYGGLIELIQLQVPGRSGEWLDLGADAVGLLAGLVLAALARAALAKRTPRP